MSTGLVKEEDVGILNFLNQQNSGFKGKMKERFSDFNVTEVTPEGKLVSLGQSNNTKQSNGNSSQPQSDSTSNGNLSYDNLSDDIKKIVSEEDFNQILKITTGDLDKHDLVVDSLSKEERKHAHGVSKLLHLDSNTLTNSGGQKVIQYQKPSKANHRGGINHGQRGRSKEEKFLHFSLYKENAGTTEIISQIARVLRTKDKYFSFAGTKDRRGRTLQRVAVSLIKPESIEKSVKTLKCKASVGDYTYHPQGLRLGDLSGNRFELAIKDVNVEKENIDSIMTYFKDHGFINYFGMQRFGTSEVPTHEIGLKILKKDLQGAIDLILMPRDHQFSDLQKVLKQYQESQDADAAFKALSYNLKNKIEGKVLNGLRNHHENDKANALKFLPSGVKQMYGHAFQSFIWNSVVSERLDKFGTKVLEGDLVEDKTSSDSASSRMKVRHIRGDEVATFSIYDVVIPLPGHSSILPDNITKDLILNKLKEHNLELNSFKNSIRDYDLPGGYRNIIIKASDVTWKLVKHDDLTDDLIHSALEKAQHQEDKGELRKIGNEEGSMTSLVLAFTLPSSCYATMALREIMRTQTDIRSLKNEEDEEFEDKENNENESQNTSLVNNENFDKEKSTKNASDRIEEGCESKRKTVESDDNKAKKLKTDD